MHDALSLGTKFQDIRILIVTPRFHPLVGGQEIQAEMLAKLLVRNGASTTILTERFKEDHLGKDKHFDFPVLHLENRWNFPLPRLQMFFKSLLYYCFHSHRFDLIIVRSFSVYSLSLGLFKRLVRPQFRSLILTDSATEIPAVSDSLLSPIYRYLFCGNDFINAISPETTNQLSNFSINPRKITQIPMVLQVSQAPDVVTVHESSRRFIYIGNVAREKGVFDLVRSFTVAYKDFTDISLDLFGFGIDKEELTALVDELEVAGPVKLHPGIPNEEVPNLFTKFDCLIYPSHTEGFGLVPFEAAAAPMRIIATRVGALEKHLKDRCTFVNIGDEQELTSAIQFVRKGDNAPVTFSNVEWKASLSHESVLSQLYSFFDTNKTITD